MDETIRVASASRVGTHGPNADAAAAFTSSALTTAAVVVDGIGTSARHTVVSALVAETAVRVGAQRGAVAGLLSAGFWSLILARAPNRSRTWSRCSR